MSEFLQGFITALREELQHYGEMLALLDQEQELVMRRATDDLLLCVAAVDAQGRAIQAARAHREHCRRAVARHLNLPPDAAFAELIPCLPADYQPLLQALVQENNVLLVRVRQRAQQNHVLLARSVELMQRLVSSLCPANEPLVYNGHGTLLAPAPAGRVLYEAIG